MKCCQPLKTREDALARMTRRSRLPPFARIQIDKIELLGVPNFLFNVRVRDRREEKIAPVAVEAVEGSVAVLESGVEFTDREDLIALPGLLDLSEAEAKIHTDYRWLLLAAGLKQRRHYEIREVTAAGSFYYPYWIGYRRRAGKWDFELVDAVSGMAQGPTMRRAVLKALCGLEQQEMSHRDTETQRHKEE